jgi:hypothetical protein
MIADLDITNIDIATNASISYSKLNLTNSIINADLVNGTIANIKLANSTISGVSLGSNLFTLTRGTYLTGSNYNGSSATTWAVDATSTNTADKVVVRDSSGNFSANTITLANNLTANQIIKRNVTTTNVLQAGGGDVAITFLKSPTGSITAFVTTTAPDGWLLCNGAAVSRTTYADLFAIIGTRFGSGNGTTTFNLPNLNDTFFVGTTNDAEINSTTITPSGPSGGSFPASYIRIAYIIKT